jgi:hypothetical protein
MTFVFFARLFLQHESRDVWIYSFICESLGAVHPSRENAIHVKYAAYMLEEW